jgi:hypothetical protein
MSRTMILIAFLGLLLAGCGPVQLRDTPDRAVFRYDPNTASLAEAQTEAQNSCAHFGRIARFSELIGSESNEKLDAVFACVP